MAKISTTPPGSSASPGGKLAEMMSLYLNGHTPFMVGEADPNEQTAPANHKVVIAHSRLGQAPDGGAAVRAWFDLLAPYGRLVITTVHGFDLVARFLEVEGQPRRAYTPASLANAVEMALTPNTYRIHSLTEATGSFGSEAISKESAANRRHVVIVIDKISDGSDTSKKSIPAVDGRPPSAPYRILALQLGEIAEFISSLHALKQLRLAFPEAVITLAVGSLAAGLARQSGLVDRVVAADVSPSSNDADEDALAQELSARLVEDFDLAIDLSLAPTKRPLMRQIRADCRAGFGSPASFPYLDLCLPLNLPTVAYNLEQQHLFTLEGFASKPELQRTPYRIDCVGARTARDNAIIWGPYRSFSPGRYIFEPFIEVAATTEGLLLADVALDSRRICGLVVPSSAPIRLPFVIVTGSEQFEFRVWSVEGAALPDFSFFGGRIVRDQPGGGLFSDEAGQLLVELVKLRRGQSLRPPNISG